MKQPGIQEASITDQAWKNTEIESQKATMKVTYTEGPATVPGDFPLSFGK